MEFRPCIDIHNGKVKQIVGQSLRDAGDQARENFVSEQDSSYYAHLYQQYGIENGHVIMLNGADSEFRKATEDQAMLALRTYPGGLQVGGGLNDENSTGFLEAGASHVIITSYVFQDGAIVLENLKRLVNKVGRERIVLDLSCRRVEDHYQVVTDRWQKFTRENVERELFRLLDDYCDEYLVHAVDVEGKSGGVDGSLIELLADVTDRPITYAGGIREQKDIDFIREASGGQMNFTIGSALDLFGGTMSFEQIAKMKM